MAVVVRSAEFLTPFGTLFLIMFLLLFAGVIVPAVWSHHRHRRNAAHRVLVLLLHSVRDVLAALRKELTR
ncbi:hypothetical protein ACIF83_11365 [Streptomyces sp. NPDC085866]|uniref:hypothetical protein n=1 Tax=Streptomyces sp. NPDC085866 TaxID=3365736 RepID=UPI0037D65351